MADSTFKDLLLQVCCSFTVHDSSFSEPEFSMQQCLFFVYFVCFIPLLSSFLSGALNMLASQNIIVKILRKKIKFIYFSL